MIKKYTLQALVVLAAIATIVLLIGAADNVKYLLYAVLMIVITYVLGIVYYRKFE